MQDVPILDAMARAVKLLLVLGVFRTEGNIPIVCPTRVRNIKPIIGVEKVKGTYVQRGQVRTFQQALKGLVDLIARQYEPGSELRVQVMHGQNLEGAEMLRELVEQRFKCTWLPIEVLSLVLGAHTGPTMVGVAYAPMAAFADVP